jgi:hypothetical protein
MSLSTHFIKAKSHILTLLGDELIGSDSLAIFELVKNAYDADAEVVKVIFENLNTPNQRIIIEDDGHGMSPSIIQNVWLTIGTDYKRGLNRKLSEKFNRVSLGNKGVGRLAVHKLAKEITLETKIQNEIFSSRLYINWPDLIKSKEYIQELSVDLEWISAPLFPKSHGTRLILSKLTTKNWTKQILRDLVRKIENIKNPFSTISNFEITVEANDHHQSWLEGIKSSTDILKDSLYYFEFEINKWRPNETDDFKNNDLAEYIWSYKFNPHSLMKIKDIPIEPNEISKKSKEVLYENHLMNNTFNVGNTLDFLFENNRNKYLINSDLNGIGPIKGKFYVFNLSSEVIKHYFGGQIIAVKEYIRDNYGIKIFRDNIRVYNYGEQTDDWLGLDLSKIQRTGDHFARKVTIGAIELDMKSSETGLTEKTNREGFNENSQYYILKTIVFNAFSHFEKIAKTDKEKIDEFLDGTKPVKKVGLSETIRELSAKLKDKNLETELNPLIKRVEKDYAEMRDVMVNSGMTGLNLGIIFHEIDREMKFINTDLNSTNFDIREIKERVKNLIQILENFSPILKQNNKIKISASNLIERARQLNINRFRYHNISLISPLLSKNNTDFEIYGAGNLLISAISNLIDNAIYWVTSKRDLTDPNFEGSIFIGTDIHSFGGNSLIIADNGTGFSLEPEEIIRPFVTNKPGGMGLGLYYANLVMEMIGGKLLFPDITDLDIPKSYNGACIVLVFPK